MQSPVHRERLGLKVNKEMLEFKALRVPKAFKEFRGFLA
jgi:hypothetical protein